MKTTTTTTIRIATTRLAAGLGLAGALLLAGCASGVNLDQPAPVETLSPSAGSGAGASSSGTSQSQVATVDLTKNAGAGAGGMKVVYFDFDSYVVKDEYRPLIEASAKQLAAAGKERLMLEGHADERGGREYNLALGQKRAEAVQKVLVLLGAPAARIEAVSFGEERPAVQGSDEAAMAKNRRVEIILR